MRTSNNRDVQSVMLLGSSALKIGEAGEFDYSGSQALKALREEGIRTIVVNPNVATVQTSEHLADEIYSVPVTADFVTKVIEKEKPDGILIGFGGQTALNCGVELNRRGVFEKHGVEVLGTPVQSIIDSEDRELFIKKLDEINVRTPKSRAVASVEEALEVSAEIGFPCMARVAFALGGLGSGVCTDAAALEELATRAFAHTGQLLIEECLTGWKEVEYEVVRDGADNCVTVCNMENLDPMGVHTGESIVVAPSQTLSNAEYHQLREIAIRVVRHLGIVGECNIQYALSPTGDGYRVIEVNARLSRSSALASKATGYPLASVAAKLALGRTLVELENSVTLSTKACFEPALDYVVIKAPRWDLKKFPQVSQTLGSSMKSVGEVMAIGRSFEEALQKALRMLDAGARGLVLNDNFTADSSLSALSTPTETRIFAIAEALGQGTSVDDIHLRTHIDKWFLHKLARIVSTARELEKHGPALPPPPLLSRAKKEGFSDSQIATATKTGEQAIRAYRQECGIRPSIKQIDTLAAEYPAKTNYLYLTYHGTTDDVSFDEPAGILVLGQGPYRIGVSVEFDWCAVTTVQTLRDLGYRALMLNNNPETVSTDYDVCDRLFFDEISLENILEIYSREKALGTIVAMGGQTANNLALSCHQEGIRILGTSPVDIDQAEDRHKFSQMLEELEIGQPAWQELTSLDEASRFADKVGFPVMIRPSYVISGAAMAVAGNHTELETYLAKAADVSPEHPVVISKFIDNAKEIDVDAVARDGKIVAFAVSEHVENAGVHSGDATLVIPPQRTYLETMRRIRRTAEIIAGKLRINGPFNIQFLAKENRIMVIECNLRASRSFPFVSKVLGYNFIEAATRIIMGRTAKNMERSIFELGYVGVKAPQFSFTRLEGADPTLNVEMSSTGEVACLGWDFEEAFLKALISVGYKFPLKKVLISSGSVLDKAALLPSKRRLRDMGVEFFATGGTADFMEASGITTTRVSWPLEDGPELGALDCIREHGIDLVINIPKDDEPQELNNNYIIRRVAVDFGIPLVTNVQCAQRLTQALAHVELDRLAVRSWKTYMLN